MIKFTLSTKQVSESGYLIAATDLTITPYPYFGEEHFLLEFGDKEFLVDKKELFKVLMATR